MVKDIVCGMNIDEKESLKIEYEDKIYHICSLNCKNKFWSNPEKYSKGIKDIIIELYNVWKIYRLGKVEVNALKDLSLIIEKGEFLAIQGSSGSGKSTMLHSIGCLDKPSRGEISLEGRDISSLNRSDLAQVRGQKIGFVFQQFNLIPTLSALKNVMLPMIFQGVLKKRRIERAKKLLNLVGLGDRIHHRPNEMSGGEMQRVAIARALANNPELILADEPTGNLDSRTGKEVIALLKKLRKEENKTIIMVTHDDKLAKEADRIVYLKDGQIIKHL